MWQAIKSDSGQKIRGKRLKLSKLEIKSLLAKYKLLKPSTYASKIKRTYIKQHEKSTPNSIYQYPIDEEKSKKYDKIIEIQHLDDIIKVQ